MVIVKLNQSKIEFFIFLKINDIYNRLYQKPFNPLYLTFVKLFNSKRFLYLLLTV